MARAPSQADAPVNDAWKSIWSWVLRVLDASVIEVSEGHYVGSI